MPMSSSILYTVDSTLSLVGWSVSCSFDRHIFEACELVTFLAQLIGLRFVHSFLLKTPVQIQSITFQPPLYCRDQSLTNLELCILLSLELPCQNSWHIGSWNWDDADAFMITQISKAKIWRLSLVDHKCSSNHCVAVDDSELLGYRDTGRWDCGEAWEGASISWRWCWISIIFNWLKWCWWMLHSWSYKYLKQN